MPMASTANRRRRHPGAILFNMTFGLVALGGLTWAGARALSPSPSATSNWRSALKSTVRRDPDPLTNNELAVALTRLGLAAEPLAAAGCSPQEITALVGRVREHLGTAI